MKPLQYFWTVSRKFYRKILFHDFRLVEITFDQSSVIFDRSNRNWAAIETFRNSRIFSLLFRSIEPKFRPIENA